MRIQTWLLVALILVTGERSFSMLSAADQACCLCLHCGCESATKVCRLTSDEKKITVTCWGIQDENFCVPGPSTPGCRHEECACQEVDPAGKACFQPKKFSWLEWHSNENPQMFTKRKLMKRTITKKVPSYKWVVEDLCETCKSNAQTAQLDRSIPIPPMPKLGSDVEVLQASHEQEP